MRLVLISYETACLRLAKFCLSEQNGPRLWVYKQSLHSLLTLFLTFFVTSLDSTDNMMMQYIIISVLRGVHPMLCCCLSLKNPIIQLTTSDKQLHTPNICCSKFNPGTALQTRLSIDHVRVLPHITYMVLLPLQHGWFERHMHTKAACKQILFTI